MPVEQTDAGQQATTLPRPVYEAEQTLQAIRNGEVDSLVVRSRGRCQLVTLRPVDVLYRVFFEELPHGAATLGPDGTILYCNPRLGLMLNTRCERLTGASWNTFVAEQDQAEVAKMLHLAPGERYEAELTLLAGDGTVVRVSAAASSFCAEKLPLICLILTDITERKRAEVARQHLESILDATELGFLRKLNLTGMGPAIGSPREGDREPEPGETSPPITATRIARGTSTLVLALGCLVLLGWLFGVGLLKSVFPGTVSMKPNTALAFIFAGTACLMITFPGIDPRLRRVRAVAAIAVTALGALSLCEWSFTIDLGIDQLLFRDDPDPIGTIIPGRMAPWTALNLALVGTALLLLDVRRSGAHSLAQTLTILSCVPALLSFFGYVSGMEELYGVGLVPHIAVHTDLAFLALAAGVLAGRWQGNADRKAMKDYGIAILAVVLAALVRWALWPLLGSSLPFLIHWPAIIAAAWYGGFRAGFLTTLLSAIFAAYFLLEPPGLAVSHPGEIFGTAFYLLLGSGLSLIIDKARESERSRLRLTAEAIAIRAGAAYNRGLIEASLDPLVTIGPDGKITDVNAATEQVTGLDRQRLIGTAFDYYFTDPRKARDGYEHVFTKGSVTDYPLTIRHKDGKQTDVLYNASVYKDVNGKVHGVFAAARDVTERNRAEAELRASEERFRTIFEQAPLGIALIDSLTTRIYEVNPRFAAIAGRSRQEMATLDWVRITHPDDVKEDLDNMEAMNTGKIAGFSMRKRYLRPDGSIVWIQMAIAPLKVEDKSKPRHLCMIEDITERLRMEDERNTAARLVEHERRRLRDMLNVIPINICLLTPDYYVRFANEAFEKCFGQCGPRRCYEALFNRDTPCPWCESFRPLTTGAPHRWRFVGPDGKIYDVHDFPFTDSDGSPLVLEVELDVTEQERNRALLEQRVQERTAELQAANQELESFAYSISHDLRAPLRAIDGFSRILQEEHGPRLPAEAQGLLDEVRAGAQRMGKLIDDLLAFSRLGRQAVSMALVQTDELVAEILRLLQPTLEGRSLDWQIGPLPPCRADRSLLRQVFVNLLDNAVKFTRHRTPGRIEVGARPGEQPGEIVYFVKDNGAGFDMQYAHKLFGVFQRLHSPTEYEGTGVGLALVQRILHKHGGRIWAAAAVGQGATFSFSLPTEVKS